MRRIFCLLIIAVTIGNATPAPAAPGEPKILPDTPWSIDLRMKRYFNSHTSYEFGNPFPPGQVPLSRLEFPINNWWAGAEVRGTVWRFSLGIEAMRSVSSESEGVFKDSDWTDDARPDLKTIYSESNCRLDPSYSFRADLDMNVSDWLGLPARLDLRPVAGFRWQKLNLMTHDGVQYEVADNQIIVVPLPGDGIQFDQTYWQYFVGVRGAYDLGRPLNLSRLIVKGQVDWAYVEGSNQDHHLLRAGNRFTYERTTGDAWHASVALVVGLTRNLNLGVELDYLRIQTTGTHRWVDSIAPADMSWSQGVKVWSDQTNLMVNLAYTF